MDLRYLEAVFANLDRWRHLPNYQLERRADVFFSVYLKPLMEETTGVTLEDAIIPELPIKRDLIWADLPTDKSVKVDYVLFAKDRSRVFFVELKTDPASRRDAQNQYLNEVAKLPFKTVVEGLCSIVRKTTAHQKYHHLLSALAALGYVDMPADMREFLYPEAKRGLSERLARVAPSNLDSAIEIWFVQPHHTVGDRCIDFAQVAAFVGREADPLGKLFAAHLLEWRRPAGSVTPGR